MCLDCPEGVKMLKVAKIDVESCQNMIQTECCRMKSREMWNYVENERW